MADLVSFIQYDAFEKPRQLMGAFLMHAEFDDAAAVKKGSSLLVRSRFPWSCAAGRATAIAPWVHAVRPMSNIYSQ